MRIATFLRALAIVLPVGLQAAGQAAPAQPPGRGGAQGRGGAAAQGRGPNFPQQQRAPADAAVLARGKGLYDANCSACHGIDLRGGQQGGPNLLRSHVLLLDNAGELIIPIVRGGRPNPTPPMPVMPAFPFPDEDIKAIAEYLHSVAGQAMPPVTAVASRGCRVHTIRKPTFIYSAPATRLQPTHRRDAALASGCSRVRWSR